MFVGNRVCVTFSREKRKESDSNPFHPIFFDCLVGWLTCLFITLFEFLSISFFFILFFAHLFRSFLAWYCWHGCFSIHTARYNIRFFHKHVDEFSSLAHSFFSFMLTHDIYGRERILFTSSSLVRVIDVVLIPFSFSHTHTSAHIDWNWFISQMCEW